MSATANFDTLKYLRSLTDSGMVAAHAEAITKANTEVFNQLFDKNLCTKTDLKELELRMYAFIVKATLTTISVLGAIQTVFHLIGK